MELGNKKFITTHSCHSFLHKEDNIQIYSLNIDLMNFHILINSSLLIILICIVLR